MVSVLQVLLQSARFKFINSLPEAPNLIPGMLNFHLTVIEAANDTYGSRSGAHDDLVLAVALALWRAENSRELVFF